MFRSALRQLHGFTVFVIVAMCFLLACSQSSQSQQLKKVTATPTPIVWGKAMQCKLGGITYIRSNWKIDTKIQAQIVTCGKLRFFYPNSEMETSTGTTIYMNKTDQYGLQLDCQLSNIGDPDYSISDSNPGDRGTSLAVGYVGDECLAAINGVIIIHDYYPDAPETIWFVPLKGNFKVKLELMGPVGIMYITISIQDGIETNDTRSNT